MAIKVTCSCGRVMNLKDDLAGKKGRCPSCGDVLHVPTLEEAAAAEAAAQMPGPAVEGEGETKACVHCGKPIPMEAVFCTHCGTHLRTGKKQEAGEGESEEEMEYDFFKAAPDMITRPLDAVSTIVEAPLSAANFKKALIFLAIGAVIFTYVIPHNSGTTIKEGVPLWVYGLTFLLTLVVVVTDGMVCGVAGSMFGSTGTGFANTSMAVLAARGLIGIAMVLPGLYLLVSGPQSLPSVMAWLPRAIRLLWGTALIYFVIFRAYDCGPVPAFVFAGVATLVRAIIFWLPSFFGIKLI